MKAFRYNTFSSPSRLKRLRDALAKAAWSMSTIKSLSFLLFILSFAVAGCARLRLPAIDPVGESIFLPLPNTTGLDVPPLRSTPGNPGLIPNPVFTEPPTPPPCLDASNKGVCNLFGGDRDRVNFKLCERLNARGKAGELQLTPMSVVAPVGGEVVLLAGICGPDGYFVQREPLEWMLSPESVGTFIEVGDDKPGRLSSFFHNDPKIEKLDVDFARGRTSSKRTMITRGTPNCNDDIKLGKGQTWLSISSPTEGISRVTVLAPDSDIWDRRRLTSTIYWIDAQWTFPAPIITAKERPAVLQTRVNKSENLVPAAGWIVEYEIVDPQIARFLPTNDGTTQIQGTTARVVVNSDGIAPVQIGAKPDAFGTSPVLVRVIRPPKPSDGIPQLIVGAGQTTVTFSSPGLNLEAFGPKTGSIGGQLTYSAVIGNPGDLQAENVRLIMRQPVGTKLIQATPQPSTIQPDVLIWDQGVLGANQQLDVSVVLEAQQASTVSVVFEAQGQNLPQRQRRVTTEIIQPQLDVRFAPAGGIAEAEVGQEVECEIDITNTGNQTLTNLLLAIESSPGLPEHYKNDNRVELSLPSLAPGATEQVAVTFDVRQTGQQTANLRVRSGDIALGTRSLSINGLQPASKQAAIDVSIEFPETVEVGMGRNARIVVRNTGETGLSDIQVNIAAGPSFKAQAVDAANRQRTSVNRDGTVIWQPQVLPARPTPDAGDYYAELFLELEAIAENAAARIQVSASSTENAQAQKAIDVAVGRRNAPVNPGVVPNPGDAARTNQLLLSLADFNDPEVVGNEIRYSLGVKNDRATPDRQINLRLKIPQGVQFKSISSEGNLIQAEFLQDGSVAIPTIEYLRPGEQINYLFILVPQIPQLMEVEAQGLSDSQQQPQTTKESTTIRAR